MKKKKINSNNLLLLITIVLFFVMYAAGCIVYADKGFTRFQTFLNILINNAGLICITAGMTCVMLTGGIDISVGSCNWHYIWYCSGLLYFLPGNPAFHRYYGRNVLCQRYDSCDL